MKPVKQTITDSTKGNCFSACIAAVLELPLESVPNFCGDYGELEYWGRLQSWLGERFGLFAVEVPVYRDRPFIAGVPSGVYMIASGVSPRHAPKLHSVVGRIVDSRKSGELRWEYVHDPHPDHDGEFLQGDPTAMLFFASMNPPSMLGFEEGE